MNAERIDERRPTGERASRAARLLLSALLVTVCGACAAGSRDPEVARPRASDAPPYPVVLGASAERRERAVNNWLALSRTTAGADAPELQPVTATVRALPPSAALRLPPVEFGANGETAKADKDEAARESLRRFVLSARDLIGADPQNLSLHEFRDEGGGAKFARYLQKPFPHPLRNGYGVVEIRFDASGRVLSLASTALPDAERLAQSVAALRPSQISADQISSRLAGRSFNYSAGSAAETFTVGPGTVVDVRELVVFPVPRANDPTALEIRLAWETVVGRAGTNLAVYADAVTGEILSAARTDDTPRATPQPTPQPAVTAPPTPAATAPPPPRLRRRPPRRRRRRPRRRRQRQLRRDRPRKKSLPAVVADVGPGEPPGRRRRSRRRAPALDRGRPAAAS